MESKRLSMAVTIGCLTICTGIVGMAAINRHESAIHPGSNSASGMELSYEQQNDLSAPIPGSGSSDRRLASEGMFFPSDSEPTAPTPQSPMLTILPATAPLSPNDPLADYVLSGFVTVDGEAEAVLEQRSTKQSWYLKAGDLWQNYRVVSVGPGQIVLAVDGQQRALAMNDAFNAVPLSADAPYLKVRELRSGKRIFTLAAEDALLPLLTNNTAIDTDGFDLNFTTDNLVDGSESLYLGLTDFAEIDMADNPPPYIGSQIEPVTLEYIEGDPAASGIDINATSANTISGRIRLTDGTNEQTQLLLMDGVTPNNTSGVIDTSGADINNQRINAVYRLLSAAQANAVQTLEVAPSGRTYLDIGQPF